MKQGRTGKIGTTKTGQAREFDGAPIEGTKTPKKTDRERKTQKTDRTDRRA